METTPSSRRDLVALLAQSVHGDLSSYFPQAASAARYDPEFLAHLIAWNQSRGTIRDAKVAMPLGSLLYPSFPSEFVENSQAALLSQSPRDLLSALRFVMGNSALRSPRVGRRPFRRLVRAYLQAREARPQWLEASMVSHRASMKELYRAFRIKPDAFADAVLFKNEKIGIFAKIASLGTMDPQEAAGTILLNKIPFSVVTTFLGLHGGGKAFALALISKMSPQELLNNQTLLQRLGVEKDPALRAAYRMAVEKALRASPKNLAVGKVTKAIASVESLEMKAAMEKIQESGLQKLRVKGNWLIAADKSGSMTQAIDLAKQMAAQLSAICDGKVHLCFFDNTPQLVDVTGLSLENILKAFYYVKAGGGTAIGVPLIAAAERNLSLDGIILISDGGQNHGRLSFTAGYERYRKVTSGEPVVYWFQLPGDTDSLTYEFQSSTIDPIIYDLRKQQIDAYSLSNLAKLISIKRYTIFDEILETPLLTFQKVLGGPNEQLTAFETA